MLVEVFTICDAATGDMGKLSLLGAFDTLYAEKVPIVHPQCAIAVRIRFSSMEEGKHLVKVSVTDTDGRHPVIQDMEGPLEIHIPEGRASASMNMILNIHGMKVSRYGEYSVDLSVDGRQEASVPLYVCRRPR